ncbi:Probable glycosyltransferase At5g25310 [Linum perenne]
MEIKRQKPPLSSTSVLLFVSVLIVTAFWFSSYDCSLIRRFTTESRFESSAGDGRGSSVFPAVELRTTVTSSNRVQAVRSASPPGDGSFVDISRFRKNTTSSSSFVVKQRKRAKPISRKEELEQGLARARASIRRAAMAATDQNSSIGGGSVYHNPRAFYQSYREMEKRFKVYVYKEGEPPMVHDGPCKDIYTVEGRFIQEMEHGSSSIKFKTEDPERAHVYFMPFSVTWMVKYLYTPLSYDVAPLRRFVADYVTVISTKHQFWNRTLGADHFMLACHDWGPHASRGNKQLHDNSIRVLCNANTSESFNPHKDVTLPEIHLHGGQIPTQLLSPPPSTTPRPYLAFFAGGLHGPIRPILLRHWQHRHDPQLPIFEYLPKNNHTPSYHSFMLSSKFCLCPSGHEVASPRIVEAIYAECVPEVLGSISEEGYLRLKEGVRAVRKHFVLNQPAKRYDVFHMILHSVWLRRLDLKLLA